MLLLGTQHVHPPKKPKAAPLSAIGFRLTNRSIADHRELKRANRTIGSPVNTERKKVWFLEQRPFKTFHCPRGESHETCWNEGRAVSVCPCKTPCGYLDKLVAYWKKLHQGRADSLVHSTRVRHLGACNAAGPEHTGMLEPGTGES